MNWSRSVVAFSGGCVRAHPPGVAPEASVECFDSSEVFCIFYRGVLSYACFVFFLSRFGFLRSSPRASTHEVDQSLDRLLLFDPHAPFLGKKEEGWGTSYYPRQASSDGLR
jgi:hypothetical protein